MLARTVPPLLVIAYDEIVLGTDVEPIETISIGTSELNAQQEQEFAGVTR
jgi:hypothetical protein